ncbi:MAG: tRNA 2-thiouridine(34) synthase MnmA [Proteobacteria bacterium]|nr:tRNA 2-thiouridine(34) synthase MnmA [Pseudomonadota bacterium]MDA1357406.1 tRNA 2-thiouridine(34) synthase MnmA [Pseudomonadota bacterium]
MSIPSIDVGIDKPRNRTRIVVAMSGGVDSSVAAALYAEAGYDVVGMTLQLYDNGATQARTGSCCAGQDIHDARRVAAHLGIAHYVLNYEDRFRREVMDEFADSYLRGETPIPCITCNQTVKFRDLLAAARDLEADALATGHYVRRVVGAAGPEMHRAHDAGRDQSYFLFATTREQLEFLRFPLGDIGKSEVRRHAERLGLAVAEKPDSQDICFVPGGDYAAIIEKLRPGAAEPGDIVDLAGAVVGEHAGIIHYTVGQRRGLGLAAPEPLYVVAVDAASRRVTVGPKAALLCDRVRLRQPQFIDSEASLRSAGDVIVRLRSTHPGAAGYLTLLDNGEAEIRLAQPEPATARGQAAVCYRGDKLLGGGWIASMERSAALSQTTAA